MPKASDLTPENRFFALFVGRSGSGKTCAEASFPKPLNVLDFDGRIRGLLGAPWINREGISYDYFQPKAPGIIQSLNKKLESLMIASVSGQPLPATWITDSITSQNYTFICQAMALTHTGEGNSKKGKWIGPIAMVGPEDYGLEAQAQYDYIAFLKSLPIPNVIVSAHVIERFGKPRDSNGNELTYADSIVIGEKLSIRDKISENIQKDFDHIFKFEREVINGSERFFVIFRDNLARTSYSQLPMGRHDITGKNFYEFMMGLITSGGGK